MRDLPTATSASGSHCAEVAGLFHICNSIRPASVDDAAQKGVHEGFELSSDSEGHFPRATPVW